MGRSEALTDLVQGMMRASGLPMVLCNLEARTIDFATSPFWRLLRWPGPAREPVNYLDLIVDDEVDAADAASEARPLTDDTAAYDITYRTADGGTVRLRWTGAFVPAPESNNPWAAFYVREAGADPLRAATEQVRRALEGMRSQRLDAATWHVVAELLEDIGVVVAEVEGRDITMAHMSDTGLRLLGREASSQNAAEGWPAEYGCLHLDGRPYEAQELPLVRAVREERAVRGAVMDVDAQAGRVRLVVDAAPVRVGGDVVAAVACFRAVGGDR